METLQEKIGHANKLFADARAILENKEATAEDKAKVAPMLEDAKALRAEAVQLKEIIEHADESLKHVENKQGKDVETPERKEKKPFKEWGEFLEAAFLANHKDARIRREDTRLQWFEEEKAGGHETKDMVESVGASGGFLVPAEFLAQLQAAQAENAIVRRNRATIIRMRRRQIDIPVLNQTATTAGVPHWFGGMTFQWAEEATQKTQSDPSFRQVELVAHKLIGYTVASDELVADSAISLADFLSGPLGFAGGVAWMEDYAFLQGTGAGQPLGVINAGATITVARQAVGTPIQYLDLVNMLENFLPSARGVWVITQTGLSNLMTLQDPVGNYVWQPNAREGVPQTVFGYPVYFTEKLPTVGNAGDVLLADFSYYLIGDRQATTVESTQYDQWRYDKTSWRVVHRVDGQPWLSAPLTLQDGTAQVSPFVILGAKST
jgi:HK97 family phage major capsid protein